MSVFVNMKNIIVQSYAGQYMCMEVIICQSEKYPEILISETHTIGGTSKHDVGVGIWTKLSHLLG